MYLPVKSKVKISQNFVAFSDNMNFKTPYYELTQKPGRNSQKLTVCA